MAQKRDTKVRKEQNEYDIPGSLDLAGRHDSWVILRFGSQNGLDRSLSPRLVASDGVSYPAGGTVMREEKNVGGRRKVIFHLVAEIPRRSHWNQGIPRGRPGPVEASHPGWVIETRER